MTGSHNLNFWCALGFKLGFIACTLLISTDVVTVSMAADSLYPFTSSNIGSKKLDAALFYLIFLPGPCIYTICF